MSGYVHPAVFGGIRSHLVWKQLRGPPFNIQGGGGAGDFVTGKLFISNCITGNCLKRTVLEVYYLSHAETARDLLKKTSAPPPPWKLNGGPLVYLYATMGYV